MNNNNNPNKNPLDRLFKRQIPSKDDKMGSKNDNNNGSVYNLRDFLPSSSVVETRSRNKSTLLQSNNNQQQKDT